MARMFKKPDSGITVNHGEAVLVCGAIGLNDPHVTLSAAVALKHAIPIFSTHQTIAEGTKITE